MKKNHEKIWNNCLNTIKENIPSNSFKLWFEPIVPLKFENNILTVQITGTFLYYEFLLELHDNILKKALIKEIGPDARCKFIIKRETKKFKPPRYFWLDSFYHPSKQIAAALSDTVCPDVCLGSIYYHRSDFTVSGGLFRSHTCWHCLAVLGQDLAP